MKKFFKFGCLGFIGLIALFIIIALFGGNDDSEKVSTGTDSKKSAETKEKQSDDSKKVDASNQKVDVLGLKVGLGEVKVSKDKIEVGINIENTASQVISFYPDQGSSVIGSMQLDANMFLTDGDIGGDIQPGVKQEAVLEFLAPDGKKIDVKTVKEIKFVFGDAVTEDFSGSKPVEFIVPIN